MKTWIAIIGLLPMIIGTAAQGADRLCIDRFESPDNKTELGGWWYVFDDARVGGNSLISPAPDHFAPGRSSDAQGYAAHLTGKSGNKLGWDFFGMGFTIMSDSGCPISSPVDLSQYRTLEFKIRGKVSAGRLSVVIPYTGETCENNVPETLTAWADYQAGVTAEVGPEWTTVRLDLRKDFSQPAWTKPAHKASIEQVLQRAHVIQWNFTSADGDTVDLWIDDIYLY